MKRPNIIIADDHLILRQGIKSLLTAENIAKVIGEASNGKELLELLKKHRPDIVIMDIDMPHMNGMEATQKALEMIPELKIIAFTMFGDEEYYYKMIDLGVKGFILKSSGIAELENAINEVMLGESYFSPEVLRKIISSMGRVKQVKNSLNVEFTSREIEVLQQICLGLNNEEIAEKLFISPKTIKSHRSNLLGKTGCKNTPTLMLYALKNNIVQI